MKNARPKGVTIMAILSLLGAMLGVWGSVAMYSMGAVVAGLGGTPDQVVATQLMGTISGVLGIVLAVVGLMFGVGAWGLEGWAWNLGVFLFGAEVFWDFRARWREHQCRNHRGGRCDFPGLFVSPQCQAGTWPRVILIIAGPVAQNQSSNRQGVN